MAEYTTHYAIAKHGPFGEGEALSAYSIINVAMDTIDSILWEHKGLIDALEERMDAAENRLTVLEQRMTTAENNITNIYENIERIDQNIDEIEETITNIQNNITNIEQEMEESNTNIWNAINNILTKVVGSNSVDEDSGDITWGVTGNIAIGNMSLFGNSGMTSYIRGRTGTGTNDVRAQ